MKVFSCGQIRDIDRYTIENEPVSSSDLMERAAGRLFGWISANYSRSVPFAIFAGPGNNGGDGLVLARMLAYGGYRCEVYDINFSVKQSDDRILNMKRLEGIREVPVFTVRRKEELPHVTEDTVIIDAIFGSGLAKPAEGLAADTISHINNSGNPVISIDMPSGLFGEDNRGNNREFIIRADHTLAFQFPRLSFFFPENYLHTGEWHILPIGLHPDAMIRTETPWSYIEMQDISGMLLKRRKFDHKGVYGHGLLAAGSQEKAGAAVLAARAALRTGIGLVTCHLPRTAGTVIQTAVPEAMISAENNDSVISVIPFGNSFSAAAAGPGTGTARETSDALYRFLSGYKGPLVLDADAINILGMNKEWLNLIPPGTVLTPHPKEFERIAGKTDSGFDRLTAQVNFSSRHNCYIVLKGACTSISCPDGRVFFNSTGNPGMATAGSGDVLTGIILALLAQGYPPEKASLAGVYIHGLAGDKAAEEMSMEALIASDIIDNIGIAIKILHDSQILHFK